MSCKVVMVIISSAILLVGVGAVIIGVLVENNSQPADGKLDEKYILLEFLHLAKVGGLLIAIGCILTVIGFLGCCGAFFENNGMLMTFFISILIMVIVEVVAVAVLLSNSPVKKLCEAFIKSIKESNKNGNFVTKILDYIINLKGFLLNITLEVRCFNAVVEWVKSNSASIAVVVFFIAALEIAAMIVSMVLYKNKPRNLQVFIAAR